MSDTNSTEDNERRKQLGQMVDKFMQSVNKSSAPKLAQAKELAETLRKALERDLDQNQALWTEKKMLQTLNRHMNQTIDDNRELIEELNRLTED